MRTWSLVVSLIFLTSCVGIGGWGFLNSGIGSMGAVAAEKDKNFQLALTIGWPLLALGIIFLAVAVSGRKK